MGVSLYLKDPSTTRFLGGGQAELEGLFGAALPCLPPADVESGREVFFVQIYPELPALTQRFLRSLLCEIGLDGSQGAAGNNKRDQEAYEKMLQSILRSARPLDRRIGLLNLFWLAHSRMIAESLRDMEAKSPAVKKLKYALHPLLCSFYRRMDQTAKRSVDQVAPGLSAFLAGAGENTSLVDSIIDDGFAFTEISIADLDFNQFLSANKRYRLSPDLFFEIHTILVRETERRLREGDRGLTSRITKHVSMLSKEQQLTPAGLAKIMMNPAILTYLLADVWTTGAKLQASPRLKAESEKRRLSEVMDSFLELTAGLRRFEVVSFLRDRIVLQAAFSEQSLAQNGAASRRLYAFGESAQVHNNAVNATVLFLDLRGFTQTSEGQISERDLTRELYAVFDAFVPHIRRFGGVIDKFLGDGIMATYGTETRDALSPLQAIRSAILCQEALQRLRAEGKTYFRMGIAIHYGRVYIARFIVDDNAVQTTVIGRNVNLAGRLSSASKKPIEEDENTPVPSGARLVETQARLGVTVDAEGILFNEGIAISREGLSQIEHEVSLEHLADATGQLQYVDTEIDRTLTIRYAGDAKFKGVRSSFPVYDVGFE